MRRVTHGEIEGPGCVGTLTKMLPGGGVRSMGAQLFMFLGTAPSQCQGGLPERAPMLPSALPRHHHSVQG